MKMRWLLAAMAICALAGYFGSVGPPEAATDTSMNLVMVQAATVPEPAAPAAILADNPALVVDNDVGEPVAVMNGNLYLHAENPSVGIKEVVAMLAPRVAVRTRRSDFALNLRIDSRASPTLNWAHHLRVERVVRT